MSGALGSLLVNAMLNYLLVLIDAGDLSDWLVLIINLVM